MIAQFAKSSRTWTVVAACLVLALGLVALTDAVAADDRADEAQPAAEQAPPPATSTVRRAERAVLTPEGSLESVAEYDYVAGAMRGVEIPSALTDLLRRRPNATDDEIEAVLRQVDQKVSAQRAQRDARGQVINQAEVEAAVKARRAELLAAIPKLRRAVRQPTRIQAGELVTVSVMNIAGEGIESVKTARVDAEGNLRLPLGHSVKAAGLTPMELEREVGAKWGGSQYWSSVSLPERGESHQLVKVRKTPAPSPGDPAMMGDPMHATGMMGEAMMMMDPAMMGMEGEMMGMSPPQEDPAAKALLSRKLPDVKFDQIPLGEVVDFFRDTLGVNVFVNWRSLEAAGIARDEPVTMRLKDVALRDVLSLMTRGVGQNAMTYKVENGVIVIDAQRTQPVAKQPKLVTEAYDVAHLLGSGTDEQRKGRLNELQAVVLNNVKAHASPFGGERGVMSISSFNLRLIITASEDGHREVKKLLDMLAREADWPATGPSF